jgi:phage tail sheath gpL-like
MATIENIMPENFLVPGGKMQFDLTNAIRGIRGMPRSLLLSGFANINSPELLKGAAIRVTSEQQVVGVAGHNSVLHQMYKALPVEVRTAMPVHIHRLDETIGTKAQQKMDFTMAAPLGIDIVVSILINGLVLQTVLTAGSTATNIATAIAAAITARSVEANATATATAGTVTVTSAFGGYESNALLFCVSGLEKADVLIDGVPSIVTAGAGDQDLSTLFSYMQQTRITEVAWCGALSPANYIVAQSQLLNLWAPTLGRDTQLMECLSVHNAAAAVTELSTRNCHQIHTLVLNLYLKSPVWAISAAAAGAIEYKATIKPSRPLRDLPLLNVLPALQNFSEQEANTILMEGGSTAYSADGVLYIQRMVTNYTKNSASVDDASYRNLEWIKTMSWWRWFVLSEFALKYRDYMLAEVWDEAFEGQDVMTNELAQEIIIGLYRTAIDNAIMQDMEGYVADLRTDIAGALGRLKYLEKPRLMTQLYQEEVTSEPIVGSLS